MNPLEKISREIPFHLHTIHDYYTQHRITRQHKSCPQYNLDKMEANFEGLKILPLFM